MTEPQYAPPTINWIAGPPDVSKIGRHEEILVAFLYPIPPGLYWAMPTVVHQGGGVFTDGAEERTLDLSIVKYWSRIPDVESEGT